MKDMDYKKNLNEDNSDAETTRGSLNTPSLVTTIKVVTITVH
jgi:hypothetical protein